MLLAGFSRPAYKSLVTKKGQFRKFELPFPIRCCPSNRAVQHLADMMRYLLQGKWFGHKSQLLCIGVIFGENTAA